MAIIQSFLNKEGSNGFVGKFFYTEGRLWGDQLEKIPKRIPERNSKISAGEEEAETIQHFLHVFATFKILNHSKAELFKLSKDFPRMPSPAQKLQNFGEPPPPPRSLVRFFSH